jgi:energy-coupling factor transporter ATP-binding protein EcfA2
MEQKEKTKFTIEKDTKLLLIGETGAGKSTTVNTVVSLLHGLGYEDERKVAIPQEINIEPYDGSNATRLKMPCNIPQFEGLNTEQKGGGQNVSQTQEPRVYKLLDKSTGKQLSIIDTPGLGDTRGVTQDDKNVNQILHAIFSMQGVNGICLVHNSSKSRLTSGVELAIKKIKNMFTKDCLKHFVVCLTFVSDPSQIACKDSLKELGIPLENVFYFENNCFKPPSKIRQINKNFNQKRLERNIENFSYSWEDNQDNFKNLLNRVYSLPLIDTNSVQHLHLAKLSSTAIIEQQTRNIHNFNVEMEFVSKLDKDLASVHRTMMKNKDYIKEGKASRVEMVKVKKTVEKWADEYQDYYDSTFTKHDQSSGWWGARVLSIGLVYAGEGVCGAVGNLITGGVKKYRVQVLKTFEVEVEEPQVVEYTIKTTDQEMKKALENAQNQLKGLEKQLEATQKKIIEIEIAKNRSYRIIRYLEVQILDHLQDGSSLTELLKKELETELEVTRRRYLLTFNQRQVFINQKLAEINSVAQESSIKANAMKKTDTLTAEDMKYLKLVQYELVNATEDCLRRIRESIEKSQPCIINGVDHRTFAEDISVKVLGSTISKDHIYANIKRAFNSVFS